MSFISGLAAVFGFNSCLDHQPGDSLIFGGWKTRVKISFIQWVLPSSGSFTSSLGLANEETFRELSCFMLSAFGCIELK